ATQYFLRAFGLMGSFDGPIIIPPSGAQIIRPVIHTLHATPYTIPHTQTTTSAKPLTLVGSSSSINNRMNVTSNCVPCQQKTSSTKNQSTYSAQSIHSTAQSS